MIEAKLKNINKKPNLDIFSFKKINEKNDAINGVEKKII